MCPRLTDEQWETLHASLAVEGCRDALVVWTPEDGDGVPLILDGHNRYRWCVEHGLAFRLVEVMDVKDRDDAKIWIIRNQLGRRNLSDFQRIELAARLRSLLSGKAKANQPSSLKQNAVRLNSTERSPLDTRQAIAEIAGVSKSTVREAEIVLNEADEPTKEAVRQRKKSIHEAYRELRPAPAKPVLRPGVLANGAPIIDSDPVTPGMQGNSCVFNGGVSANRLHGCGRVIMRRTRLFPARRSSATMGATA